MRLALALAALILASLPGVGLAAPLSQDAPSAPAGQGASNAPVGQAPSAPADQGTGTTAGGAPVPVAAGPGGGLFIESDLVIGAPGPCVLQSRFHPGDRVVFRAKVYDAQTGQLVPSATVVVRLEDGTNVPLNYGPHPPPNVGPSEDQYWSAAWAIRPDTPMGIVHYTIDATDGTRTGHFEPFNNMTSLLTIVPPES